MHHRTPIYRLGVWFVCTAAALLPQTAPPPGPDTLPPEILTYGIEWRLLRAGVAKLAWSMTAHSRPVYDVNLHLESAGTLARLYKVDDQYHTHLEENFCADYFTMRSLEGKRSRDMVVNIDRSKKKASYLERDLVLNKTVTSSQTDVPACVPDVLGALQRLRLATLNTGQSMQIPVTDGKKWTNAKVEAQERETVKTPTGTYKTLRYEVYIFDGALFQRKGRLLVWLTDDARKLPVQVQMRFAFPVGTVTLQLEKEEKT